MATTHYYVDPISGSDTTGDGLSDATAWQTINYGIDNAPDGTASAVTQINVKSNGTHTLTSQSIMAGGGNLGSQVLRGYDSVANDGGIATIDCDQLYGITLNTYASICDLYFINRGTGNIISNGYADGYIRIKNCGFNGANGVAINLSNSSAYMVEGCYFYDCLETVASQALPETSVCNSFIQKGPNNPPTAAMVNGSISLIGNMIWTDGATHGILNTYNGARYFCRNNSIFSDGGTGSGIQDGGNSTFNRFSTDNAIEGFSGVGGHGIKDAASNYRLRLYSNNAVSDCDTGFSSTISSNNLFHEDPVTTANSIFTGGTLPSPATFASNNSGFWNSVRAFFTPTSELTSLMPTGSSLPGAVHVSGGGGGGGHILHPLNNSFHPLGN